MRESELAILLIQMGVDRGVEVERAVDELATMALPSFVDQRQFRTAVVEALEAHIRDQMEQRLELIRRRFEVPGGQMAGPSKPPASPTPPNSAPFAAAEPARPSFTPPRSENATAPVAPVRQTATPELPPLPAAPPPVATDATIQALDAEVPPDSVATPEDEELPTDATMVWTTRHG